MCPRSQTTGHRVRIRPGTLNMHLSQHAALQGHACVDTHIDSARPGKGRKMPKLRDNIACPHFCVLTSAPGSRGIFLIYLNDMCYKGKAISRGPGRDPCALGMEDLCVMCQRALRFTWPRILSGLGPGCASKLDPLLQERCASLERAAMRPER